MTHLPIMIAEGRQRTERREIGKQMRVRIPRSVQSSWQPSHDRKPIVELLALSNRDRIDNLVPIRHGRMLRSPLAFFRGLAVAMVQDLATLPTTEIRLQICGDCHFQNFGWFATPERRLVFDINDFDETLPGPWEWDLKRLVTSFVLATRELSGSKGDQLALALSVVREYRERMLQYEAFSPLQMWYERIDAESLVENAKDPATRDRYRKIIATAKLRTIDVMLPNITNSESGRLRITDQPPLIFHPSDSDKYLHESQQLIHAYSKSLTDDRRVLLDRYRFVDAAYKVVGVGSVGLRCGIVLLNDVDHEPLLLQIKEARESVLQPYVGPTKHGDQGLRIVHGQRMMQAASDVFLGWGDGPDGRPYFVRQLRDMKLSIELDRLTAPKLLYDYGKLCGWTLARAHAKSGYASYIAGYAGTGDQLDIAIQKFAMQYADQVEKDFKVFQSLVQSGKIEAQEPNV